MQEMINIGIGKAAGALNQMTGSHIQLEAPRIKVLTPELLFAYREEKEKTDLDIVKLVFRSVFSGVTGLLFERKQATALVGLLLGRAELMDDTDALRCDTLREIGNIVLIWIMGAIGNLINEHVEYLPLEHQWNFESLVGEHIGEDDIALRITAEFLVESHRILGEVIILLNAENYAMLLGAIDELVARGGA
jgi:chemotaxis protein CheC